MFVFSTNLRRLSAVALLFLCISQSFANDSRWQSLKKEDIKSNHPQFNKPLKADYYSLDMAALKSEFLQAPKEKTGKIRQYGKIISLPVPNGGFQRFVFASYSIMEEPLEQRWGFVKTYTGQGIDDPAATIKVDFTSFGFHYQVLSPKGQYYADPVFHGDDLYYQIYKKSDLDPASKGPFMEHGVEDSHNHGMNKNTSKPGATALATGSTLRTYRIAIAATGEYTAFHGGLNQAASAMVTTLNRVNGLYENDVAIRFILVANNNQLIYTSTTADPYTNNSGPTMLGQNQSNLTALIGTANYDIGHVFSTGGGGIAGLGVVCSSGSKARGVTGSNSPIGDPFDIDYVAHEVGHQFGGNHTFNSITGSCGGNNRSANSAFEPGSGNTIMAYAGICGNDNIQSNSNAYFHFKSYEDIVTYSNTGGGNSCPVKTQTGNTAPVIPAIQSGYVLPISTSFKLTASQATDVDNDTLTYCWEENDLGAGGAPGTPVGNAPILRSYSPVESRERVFPRWPNLLANTTALGERLPTYARTLNFKLTVRDNNAGAGGVNSTTVNLTVNATGGPFAVTMPNTTAISWEAGSNQTITWNAAGTATTPFNSPKVRIKLSTDGGSTFPIVLKDTTQNDGSELITLPVIPSNTCRVLIESVGNLFFDVSNANFKIIAPTTATIPMNTADTSVCAGQTFKVGINPTGTTYLAGNVFSIQLSNALGLFTNPITIGTVTSTGADSITATVPVSASGNGYKLRITSSNPVRSGTQIINAPKIKGLPAVPGIMSGSTSLCANDSTSLFTVPAVTGLLYTWTLPTNSTILTNPDSNTIRIRFAGQAGTISVKARNACGNGLASTLNLTPIVILPATVTAVASTNSPCSGTTVQFTANPVNGGTSPAYQWLKNDTVIQNATNSTYSTNALVTGNKFKVILTSSLTCGTPNVATSSQITITVNVPRTPSATIESNALNDTSCAGEPLTFSSLTANGGGTSPQFAWFKNTTAIAGQTGQTLVLSNLQSTDSIRLRYTVTGNCLTINQVFSSAIRTRIMQLTANAGVDTAICPNATLTFIGQPSGGQWTGQGVNSGGNFVAGATGNSVLIYQIERYGCIRSDVKTVSVIALPPVFYAASGNLLTATASGASSWNWYLNDTVVPNANSAAFTMEESGFYCAEAVFTSGCTKKSTCAQQTFTTISDDIQNQDLSIFPNPASSTIRIKWSGRYESFELLNLIGQSLIAPGLPSSVSVLDLSVENLPKGVYKLQAITSDGKRVFKSFVKD